MNDNTLESVVLHAEWMDGEVREWCRSNTIVNDDTHEGVQVLDVLKTLPLG